MGQSKRRMASLIVSIMMVMQLLPVSVFAEQVTGGMTFPTTYGVHFVASNGTSPIDVTLSVAPGTDLTASPEVPAVPEVDGYTFSHWVNKSANGVKLDSITADTLFRAAYYEEVLDCRQGHDESSHDPYWCYARNYVYCTDRNHAHAGTCRLGTYLPSCTKHSEPGHVHSLEAGCWKKQTASLLGNGPALPLSDIAIGVGNALGLTVKGPDGFIDLVDGMVLTYAEPYTIYLDYTFKMPFAVVADQEYTLQLPDELIGRESDWAELKYGTETGWGQGRLTSDGVFHVKFTPKTVQTGMLGFGFDCTQWLNESILTETHDIPETFKIDVGEGDIDVTVGVPDGMPGLKKSVAWDNTKNCMVWTVEIEPVTVTIGGETIAVPLRVFLDDTFGVDGTPKTAMVGSNSVTSVIIGQIYTDGTMKQGGTLLPEGTTGATTFTLKKSGAEVTGFTLDVHGLTQKTTFTYETTPKGGWQRLFDMQFEDKVIFFENTAAITKLNGKDLTNPVIVVANGDYHINFIRKFLNKTLPDQSVIWNISLYYYTQYRPQLPPGTTITDILPKGVTLEAVYYNESLTGVVSKDSLPANEVGLKDKAYYTVQLMPDETTKVSIIYPAGTSGAVSSPNFYLKVKGIPEGTKPSNKATLTIPDGGGEKEVWDEITPTNPISYPGNITKTQAYRDGVFLSQKDGKAYWQVKIGQAGVACDDVVFRDFPTVFSDGVDADGLIKVASPSGRNMTLVSMTITGESESGVPLNVVLTQAQVGAAGSGKPVIQRDYTIAPYTEVLHYYEYAIGKIYGVVTIDIVMQVDLSEFNKKGWNSGEQNAYTILLTNSAAVRFGNTANWQGAKASYYLGNDLFSKDAIPRADALALFPDMAFDEQAWRISLNSEMLSLIQKENGGNPEITLSDVFGTEMTLSDDFANDYLLQLRSSGTIFGSHKGLSGINGFIQTHPATANSSALSVSADRKKLELYINGFTGSNNSAYIPTMRYDFYFVTKVSEELLKANSATGTVVLNNNITAQSDFFHGYEIKRGATGTLTYSSTQKDAALNQPGLVEWRVKINQGKNDTFIEDAAGKTVRIIDELASYLELTSFDDIHVMGSESGPIPFTPSLVGNTLTVEVDAEDLNGQLVTLNFRATVKETQVGKKSNTVYLEWDGVRHITVESPQYTMEKASGGYILPGSHLNIVKKDRVTDAVLVGVHFALYVKNGDGTATLVPGCEDLTTDGQGKISVSGLDPTKTYILQEKATPSGYKTWIGTINGVPNAIAVMPSTVDYVQTVYNAPASNGFWVYKVDEKGAPINIVAEFTAVNDSNPADQIVKTTVNGVAYFNNLNPGNYTITETGVPSGYNGTPHTFKAVVDADGDVTLTLVNGNVTDVGGDITDIVINGLNVTVTNQKKANQGQLTLHKTETGNPNKPLQGAVFELKDSAGTILSATTDAAGQATFSALAQGVYTLSEQTAPAGYNKETKTWTVVVGADGKVTMTGEAGFDETAQTLAVGNQLIVAQLEIFKQDERGNQLKDAGFTLTVDSIVAANTQYADTAEKFTTSANGYKVTYANLPQGAYTLTETTVPAGYKAASNSWKITVDAQGDVRIDGQLATLIDLTWQYVAVNNKVVASFSIFKEDENGNKLSGATFTLTAKTGSPAGSANGVTFTTLSGTTTQANGYKVDFTDVPQGSYTLTETQVPNGYAKIGNKDTWDIVVGNDGKVSIDQMPMTENPAINLTPYYVIMNRKVAASFSIFKEDENGRKLIGAQFTLTGTTADQAAYGPVQKTTTATQNVLLFDNLPQGTYTLTETQFPAGYEAIGGKTSWQIVVNADGTVDIDKGQSTQVIDLTQAYRIANRKVTGEFALFKTDENGNKLAGAEFTLSGTPVNGETFTPVVKTTGADGYIAFPGVPQGSYTLKETKLPIGYVLMNEHKNTWAVVIGHDQSVTVDGEKIVDKTLNLNDVYTIANKRYLASLTILKTDAQTGHTLAGALFTLTGGTPAVTLTGTTNQQGILVFSNLAHGEYTLEETWQPEGYRLAAQTWRIVVDSVTRTVTWQKQDVTNTPLNIKNEPAIPGALTLEKVDLKTGAPLMGAEFKLTGGKPQVTLTATTGADGKASFTGLTAGDYTLTETKAPYGYLLKKDSWQVTVDTEGIVSIAGKTLGNRESLRISNERVTPAQFSIKKISSVSGLSIQGAEFTLTNKGTGSTQTVTTDESGNATFTGLLPGTYTLKETKAPSGYHAADTTWTITVDATGILTAPGMRNGVITIVNVPIDTPTPTPTRGGGGGGETTLDITVTKTWVDNNNAAGNRPGSITIQLFQKLATDESYPTTPYQSASMSGTGNTWTYTFTELPKASSGVSYNYLVQEVEVADYTVAYANNGQRITNTYEGVLPTPTPFATPTAPRGGGTTFTSRTPLGVKFVDGEWVYIDEYDTPLGVVPLTGDDSNWPLWMAAAMIPMLGVGVACVEVLRRKKKTAGKPSAKIG